MSEGLEKIDIERRVQLSLAIGRYLRSVKNFEHASVHFSEACQSLRQKLNEGERFIAKIDFDYYLVEMGSDGNFDVTKTDII
jgi:hypothetical protein